MSNELIERIVIHTDSVVKGFFGEYRWLSNYHVCPVVYESLEYKSSEAAYQAAKTTDEYLRKVISEMEPDKSRKAGRSFKARKDWDRMKKKVMYEVLKDKFTRNVDLREKLLNTGSKYLEETNYWGDTYWGVHEGKGKNQLGEVIMQIRKEIQDGLI